MDKVIIDKVDVSECEFCMYEGFKAFPQCKLNKDSFATACVQHKDCYYKQLQRAKAENFELKESLKVYERPEIKKILTLYRTGELDRLEQENERLKISERDLSRICQGFKKI